MNYYITTVIWPLYAMNSHFLLLLLDNPDLLVRKGLTSDATYRVLTLLMHAQTNQPGGSHTLC